MRRIVVLCGLLGLWVTPLPSHATIHTATACTVAAVNTAVGFAVDGDTVQLPACTQTAWNGTVTITKSIHVKGAGREATTIRKTATSLPHLFIFGNGTTKLEDFSLCCMTLEGTVAGPTQASNDVGVLLRIGVDFLVYDMRFLHFFVALTVHGDPTVQRGVIYKNIFKENFREEVGGSSGYGIQVRGSGSYPPLALGTNQNLFIEENHFELNRHSVESENGSSYVVRYNTFLNNRENAAPIDAHGRTPKSWPRGSRQWEIYHNTIRNETGVNRFAAIGLRGGDGVVFNNTITGPYTHPLALWLEDAGEAPGCGNCTYPCQDQTSQPFGNAGGRAYVWGNTRNGVAYDTVTLPKACDPPFLQQGRDYIQAQRPGYVPWAYPHAARLDGVGPPATPPGAPILVQFTPAP